MGSVSRDDPIRFVWGQSRKRLVHQAKELGLAPPGKGELVGGGEKQTLVIYEQNGLDLAGKFQWDYWGGGRGGQQFRGYSNN